MGIVVNHFMHFHFAIGHNNKYVGTVRYPDVQNWKKHVQCNNICWIIKSYLLYTRSVMFLSAVKLLIRCLLHYSVKRSLRCNHSITELITILIGQTLSLKFCNPIPLLLEMAKRWRVLKLTTTRSACLCLSPYISNCQSVLKSPQQSHHHTKIHVCQLYILLCRCLEQLSRRLLCISDPPLFACFYLLILS